MLRAVIYNSTHLAHVQRVRGGSSRLVKATTAIIVMHFLPPVGFDEVVALEDALNGEIIFLIALVEQRLLNDCEFRLQDPEEARVASRHTDLATDLKVLVEEDLLPNSPTYVHPTQCYLIVIGLSGNFLRCQDPRACWREEEGQFSEENEVNEVILRSITVKNLILIQVDDGAI